MNVEIPPAQDSLKHILNALNDDCIQLILRQLENVLDFLNAAETCTRFQENAKLSFRSRFDKIQIDKLHNNTFYSKIVTTDLLPSFLNIFGPLVMGIDFNKRAVDERIGDIILNMIADRCGKTLRILRVESVESDNSVVNFNTRSPFQALEELEIWNTTVYKSEIYSQLTTLRVSRRNTNDLDWFIQAFPKLRIANFCSLHHLQCNQLIGFLELNPQLKSLNVDFCNRITPQFLENIDSFTPNLEQLSFLTYIIDSPSSNHHMIQIGNLRKLKYLCINPTQTTPIKELIDSLIENDVPIEILLISGECRHISISELNIWRLKLLKKLYLPQVSDELLIDLVQNLPELQEIVVATSSFITLNGIKQALRYGKHLSVLMINAKVRSIDLDDFNLILNLAELARVKVIIAFKGETNVPINILEENREWLDITMAPLFDIHCIIQWFHGNNL